MKLREKEGVGMSKTSRTCIIGDIHGCFKALKQLLPLVEDKADSFVFLGDYIDRGPHSKEVVESIIDFQQRQDQVITLLGNHELMFLDYLMGCDPSFFLKVGGRETLNSYGIKPKSDPEKAKLLIPESHLHFFHHLQLFWENQHGIYVHAGVDPEVSLGRQVSAYCLWVRDDFINCQSSFGKPVVFGHTVFQEPLVQANKIGIDTGAVYGGKLTALILPEREWITVDGKGEEEDSTSLLPSRLSSLGAGRWWRFFR